VVLVERAHEGGTYGGVARLLELPAGEVPQRRLVQDRLGGRREPPALGQQPGLEGFGVLDAEAVEEVPAEPREPLGLAPVAVDDDVRLRYR
jgi:hypothetical protein